MTSRLVIIPVENPIPGQVKPRLISELGKSQATLYHRAAMRVFFKQLCGLEDCSVHFTFPNAHDEFPVQQLISPLLSELPHWKLIPHEFQQASSPLDYLSNQLSHFEKAALIHPDCLELSSRWIHAAFAQLSHAKTSALGLNQNQIPYLTAYHQDYQDDHPTAIQLPTLPLLETEHDWQTLLKSPLGPYLKKSYDLLSSPED